MPNLNYGGVRDGPDPALRLTEARGVPVVPILGGPIRAEVRRCTAPARLGAAAKVREAGRLHSEGRDYLVQDGDLLLFRFQP